MDTERNRAWRRRKSRQILTKIKKTRDWIACQFHDPEAKTAVKELKHHRRGALTHLQDLRTAWAQNQEIRDPDWGGPLPT